MMGRVFGTDTDLDPDCQASRLLPRYSGTLLDGSDPLEIKLVVLDPLNGEVLALEGRSSSNRSVNVDAKKNPGSLITPFIYLNQFTQGLEPASLVWDVPLENQELSAEDLHPDCVGECKFQGPVNIRTALVNDYLAPASRLWETQGSARVEDTLAVFGFSLEGERCLDCPVFSAIPGLDLIDIAQGYGVFVNQGFLRGRAVDRTGLDMRPAAVLEIRDPYGWAVLPIEDLTEKKVISEQLAFLVNHALSDQSVRLDGDIYPIGRTTSVKSGFVPDGNSAWVVGYTPQLVTAVWTGSSGSQEVLSTADYQEIGAGLWRAITQYSTRDLDNLDWEEPQGILTIDVCYPSGMLPSEYCPREVREVFIEGNQPQAVDNLYQAYQINRETGLLASVFTPPQLIEERVYLNLPTLALSWAEEEGISPPPSLYDLDSAPPAEGVLALSSPENLSFVSGLVRLIGSIPEEDFGSARLQYGTGMNPSSWLQIGDEITAPAQNQRLETWDTRDIEDGVYAVQLVLVKRDQSISKASLILSVDNTPPEIILQTDFSDGIIPYSPGKNLIFAVDFSNASEIQSVEYLLNGVQIGIRENPPFILPWEISRGSHQLDIRATDKAGNQNDLLVAFQVTAE
jgi:membrane carboxypeptidase/penicillin-binding protein PbpC